MKLNSRKPITPVMPQQVSTGSPMTEDAVNKDNMGLYKNLNERDQYLTYNQKTREISVMKITRDRSKVIEVIPNISPDIWVFMTTLMKEYVAKDTPAD